MSKPVSRRTVLAGLGAATLAAPHVARAAIRTVRLGHNNIAASHFGQGADAFAAAAAADPALAGALRIEVHPNAELGDELGMLKDCAKGTLELVICSNAPAGGLIRDLGVLNAPFLFRDVSHARTALDGPVGAEYAKSAQASGVNVLAWGENGLRHITANRPIRTLTDLHGLKIRVPQSEVMQGGLRALGAEPAQLSFGLLREALRTGQFEAEENPIVIIESVKLYEFQKFVSLTGHIYDPALFAASADLMEDLTDAEAAALRMCARTGAAKTRQVADAAQTDGLARLKAAGMGVIEDVDVAAFRTASRPYLEGLSSTYGANVQRLMAAGA